MKKSILFLFVVFISFLASCGGIGVQRMDTKETADLSGNWNDTDSRLVAEQMINEVLNAGWLRRFKSNSDGKIPVAVVGKIRNMSDEHINTRTFVKNLERYLVNSGDVDFVASKQERGELRDEIKEQAMYSSDATAKNSGEEIGADVMLQGTINTITDKVEGKAVKYYQVNMELINIETHQKLWIGEKQIKKFVKQSKFGF